MILKIQDVRKGLLLEQSSGEGNFLTIKLKA